MSSFTPTKSKSLSKKKYLKIVSSPHDQNLTNLKLSNIYLPNKLRASRSISTAKTEAKPH